MQRTIDAATVKELRRRLSEGQGSTRISSELGISTSTISKYRHAPDPLIKDEPKPQVDRIEELKHYHREKFLELQERFKTWVGDTGKFKAPTGKPKKRMKVLSISDVHCPFHHEEKLAKAIRDNADADECWIKGDLQDLFGVSRYPKSRQQFSLVEEFQSSRAVMRTIAEKFKKVKVLPGNHDERWIKYLIGKGIPPDVLEFMRMAFPGSTSPLHKLCADFENVEILEPKRIDYAEYGYIHQIGDCVLSHAEKYSSVPGKSVVDVIERCKKKLEPMGVVKDFRVVIHAHTHTATKVWADYGVVGIESGCLSRTPDYDSNPRMFGRQPVHGYVQVYQENGVTDINATNFIHLP